MDTNVVNGPEPDKRAEPGLTGRYFRGCYVCHFCAKFKSNLKKKRKSRSKNKDKAGLNSAAILNF
jgi:predicted RNA-binding protein YlxR (DUF448 family)